MLPPFFLIQRKYCCFLKRYLQNITGFHLDDWRMFIAISFNRKNRITKMNIYLSNCMDTLTRQQKHSVIKYDDRLFCSILSLRQNQSVWFKAIAFLGLLLFFISTYVGTAATVYVNVNSANPISPYNSWGTAAKTIQDAVDVAQPSDVVVVKWYIQFSRFLWWWRGWMFTNYLQNN